MKTLLPLIVVSALATIAVAQDPAPETPAAADKNPIHDELRALRDRMFKQYKERDLDGLLTGVEDNIVITWQNGERNLNQEEFVAFYNKMMKGDDRIVQDVTSDFEVDGLSVLYGDETAVAFGTCVDHFKLTDGRNLDLTSKWTATVVKTDGDWKVASYHTSANIFDNPILDTATNWLWYAGIGGGILGLVLGFILARATGRRTAAPSCEVTADVK